MGASRSDDSLAGNEKRFFTCGRPSPALNVFHLHLNIQNHSSDPCVVTDRQEPLTRERSGWRASKEPAPREQYQGKNSNVWQSKHRSGRQKNCQEQQGLNQAQFHGPMIWRIRRFHPRPFFKATRPCRTTATVAAPNSSYEAEAEMRIFL